MTDERPDRPRPVPPDVIRAELEALDPVVPAEELTVPIPQPRPPAPPPPPPPDSPLALESERAQPPANAKSRATVADEPFPCPGCGYDLRGRPSGARCPECGSVIPRRSAVAMGRGVRSVLRDELQSAWLTLGWTALAPVALLSPLPCILPIGAAVPVCIGFAPAFRLVVVRHFTRLPDELRRATAPAAVGLRAFATLELVFAGILALCAAAMTFGIASGLATTLYLPLVVVWWAVSALALRGQLDSATVFARALSDPSAQPIDGVGRARLALAVAAPVGLAGFGLIAAGTMSGAGWGSPLSIFGAILALAAAATHAACAILARNQAEAVAACIIECEALRERDLRLEPRLDRPFDATDTDDPGVRAVLRKTSGAPASGDDDAPIPLS